MKFLQNILNFALNKIKLFLKLSRSSKKIEHPWFDLVDRLSKDLLVYNPYS